MFRDVIGSGFGARHLQCFMVFLGTAIAYSLRVNLSVGIVSMTTPKVENGTTIEPEFPVLPWDGSMKGTILSSFFWGYLLLQIPAGQLAEKFGPKVLLTITIFISGFITALTPFVAIYGGFRWMLFTRVVLGAVQGFLYPSMSYLLAKWTPTPERGRLVTWVYNGNNFGNLVTMAVAGVLADSRWGWPSIFYVSGGIAILWALVYCYVGANNPQDSRTISEAERKYILSTLPSSSTDRSAQKTPWKEIVTSVPMWAVLISHLGQNWGFWTLLTQIPSYITNMFGLDIKKSGYLSALPYASSFVLALVYAAIGDALNNKNILTRTASRKMWNTVALWGPALTLCLLAFSGTHETLALFLLVSSLALNSAVNLGFLSNHMDLSPNFAGTLMGITNGLANITSIAGPLYVGYIVTDPKSLVQWRIVFLTSAALFFVGNLIFILFGTAEVQPWNAPQEEGAETETASKEKEQQSNAKQILN
ncbi:putative inorganic phosphate cotransporter isoform X2 [Bemisia tabaci]|uniref:putative inorganic phosphate cotransporter isoform X2 n=1 Tax=Bemisia tabaci TaxID=7038 RepID=UPI003B28CFF7